jgi:hypothetical protein
MRGATTVALILVVASAAAAERSREAIRDFKREHPCPITEQPRGPCPGYQIDHRQPLKCGGADRPENMQWLTVEDHKAKTRREAQWCRRPK